MEVSCYRHVAGDANAQITIIIIIIIDILGWTKQ